MRYRGPSSSAHASSSWRAVHSAVGCSVTLRCTSRRLLSVPPNGATGPRVACSLSVTQRESARTVHGRRSEHRDRPVPDPPRGRGAWMSDGHERGGGGFGEAHQLIRSCAEPRAQETQRDPKLKKRKRFWMTECLPGYA